MNPTDAQLGAMGPRVIFAMDLEGRCTLSVGPGLEGLGLRQNQLVGADLYAVYDDPDTHELFRRVLRGESFTTERTLAGRALSTFWHPVLDPGSGAVTGAIGVTTDVTEQQAAAAEAARLRERTNALTSLSNALALEVLDLDSVLQLTITSATDLLADFGAVWLRTPDGGRLTPRSVWHTDADTRGLVQEMASSTRNEHGWLDVSTVEGLVGPRPFEWCEIKQLGMHDGTMLGQLADAFGPQVGMRLPLRARGRLVGLIDLARPADRGPFTADEVALGGNLAERSALALENALLLQEQREAREELVKFKALADASRDLVGISSPDGTPAYLNSVIMGLGLDAPAEQLWASVVGTADPATMADLDAALREEKRWAGELVVQVGEERRIIHADVFPLYHPDNGVMLGTAWIGRDVTGLRDSEKALREANADLVQFQTLVEASPDFIAIAALDGGVRYVNPAGRRLIGMDPSVDVTETTIVDYLTPEGITASLEVEQPAVKEHGHWEGESTLKHRSGDPIPVAITSFLMRDPATGQPFALVTVQRDISERLAAEQALRELGRQREGLLARLVEAEEAERAKIADNVHDDSVQAMAAVDLRLGLLERRLRERAPELLDSVRPLQDIVSGAIERLRELLFDLEAPDLQDGLARALARAAEHMFEDAPTEVVVESSEEPEMPEAVRSVAYRIAREALVNAYKHADAGTVTIDVREVSGGLQVSVTDDGKGLAHATGNGQPSGAADRYGHYGLSAMRDRAAVVGGHCEIREARPRGTVVTVWLPGPSQVARDPG